MTFPDGAYAEAITQVVGVVIVCSFMETNGNYTGITKIKIVKANLGSRKRVPYNNAPILWRAN